MEQNPYAPPKHSSTGFSVIENRDLRASSRQQLKGVWGKMALAGFIYFLIVYPALFIFSEISPLHNTALDVILTIAFYAVMGPFYLGFSGFFLKRIRGEEIFVKNIFLRDINDSLKKHIAAKHNVSGGQYKNFNLRDKEEPRKK